MAQLRPRRAGAPALQLDAVDGIQILRTGEPDEVREFDLGRLELYRIGTLQIGRAIYEPGWRWSEHVRPVAGTDLCEIGHVGLVVSGSAAVRMANGEETVMSPGDFFAIPGGHDSWVIGDERYVSLHLLGAEAYAAPTSQANGAPDLEAAS
jgi:quercetin dioxygenase-like cupin family protein